jgi:hypothetical protein
MSLNGSKAEMKMYGMGKRYRAGHAKETPIGDKVINAVRGAIWEAVQMGLNNGGQRIYPAVPLLEQRHAEPQEAQETAASGFWGERRVWAKLKAPQEPTPERGPEEEPGEPVEPVEPPWEPEL